MSEERIRRLGRCNQQIVLSNLSGGQIRYAGGVSPESATWKEIITYSSIITSKDKFLASSVFPSLSSTYICWIFMGRSSANFSSADRSSECLQSSDSVISNEG